MYVLTLAASKHFARIGKIITRQTRQVSLWSMGEGMLLEGMLLEGMLTMFMFNLNFVLEIFIKFTEVIEYHVDIFLQRNKNRMKISVPLL